MTRSGACNCWRREGDDIPELFCLVTRWDCDSAGDLSVSKDQVRGHGGPWTVLSCYALGLRQRGDGPEGEDGGGGGEDDSQ